MEYDGTPREQVDGSFKVTTDKGTVVVTSDKYDVTYEKNIRPGTAKLVLTGKPEAGFTGKLTKTFAIEAYDVARMSGDLTVLYQNGETTTEWTTIMAEAPAFPYNAGGVRPEPVVVFRGKTLVKDKDYTLSWSANTVTKTTLDDKKDPTVTIRGKGDFRGSTTRKFKIGQQNFASAVTVIASDIRWENKKDLCKPKITVIEKSTGKILREGRDYWSMKDLNRPAWMLGYKFVSVPDGKKVYNTEGAEVMLTPYLSDILPNYILPEGTVVQVTIGGKGAYTDTEETAVTTTFRYVGKPESITGGAFKVTIAPQQWTGSPVELSEDDITVTHKVSKTETRTLKLGEDFEIVEGSYLNNTKRGTAKVTLRGLDNGTIRYGGTRQVSFKIVQRRMNYALAFDANGGSGTMKAKEVAYGAKLPKCAFRAPAGKSFAGWAIRPDGAKVLDDKAPFLPSWLLRLTYDDGVTLYALWE